MRYKIKTTLYLIYCSRIYLTNVVIIHSIHILMITNLIQLHI